MARAACCALLLQLQCAAAITCTDFFGETKPGRVTIVSPDEGVSGSLAVLQGPSGDCRPPQPQRCSRYFQWYYDPGCVDAAAGAGGFDPVDGVLNDCRASAWKGRTVCLRSSAGAVTSCDCPASAVSYSRSGPVFHVAVFVAVVLVSGAAAACGLAGVTGAAPVLLLTRNLQVHDAVAWAQLPLAAAAAVLVQTRPRRPEKETDAVILVALLPLALIGGAAGTVISRHIPVGAGVVVMVAVMAVDAAAFAYTAGRSGNGQQEPESTLLPDIPEVPADTELLSRNSYMLDIRPEPERREQGSIVSADHIEISEVEAGHLPEVDKETEIIVLGRAGADRARAVTQMLKECGFCNVKVLKGGIDQWNRTVEPLYRGVYLPDDSRVGLLWLAERSLRGEAPPHVIDIRTSSEVEADRVAGLEEMPPTHIQAEDIISGARMPDCQRDACIVLVGQGSMQRCARAWEELSRNCAGVGRCRQRGPRLQQRPRARGRTQVVAACARIAPRKARAVCFQPGRVTAHFADPRCGRPRCVERRSTAGAGAPGGVEGRPHQRRRSTAAGAEPGERCVVRRELPQSSPRPRVACHHRPHRRSVLGGVDPRAWVGVDALRHGLVAALCGAADHPRSGCGVSGPVRRCADGKRPAGRWLLPDGGRRHRRYRPRPCAVRPPSRPGAAAPNQRAAAVRGELVRDPRRLCRRKRGRRGAEPGVRRWGVRSVPRARRRGQRARGEVDCGTRRRCHACSRTTPEVADRRPRQCWSRRVALLHRRRRGRLC
eukprot:TRINITY_DN24944_c0_g1_i1.p1 TRINITY_DN24944_c0_g1~~TRINITY_DN24944_c0_g1_i1.p1  ORF type:complete len:785 (+),score=99.97 TRINITY_DN24944_c0_g1_i1:46-2355(+)